MTETTRLPVVAGRYKFRADAPDIVFIWDTDEHDADVQFIGSEMWAEIDGIMYQQRQLPGEFTGPLLPEEGEE